MTEPSVCIVAESPDQYESAQDFAHSSNLPLLESRNPDCPLQLCYGDERIELFDTALNTSIYVDFVEGALAHRQQFGGGRGQAIAKAVGLKKGNTPSVLDVTAGLARDAYILANLGCKILLVERSPVIYTLIKDGIRRGLEHESSKPALENFMNLVNADACLFMDHMPRDKLPDIIYIDPMYPERKKSALVKKDMQILQHLLGKDDNAASLLETALNNASQRVVIKRPIHADPVSDIKPTTSISSKKTRYDIYLCHNKTEPNP